MKLVSILLIFNLLAVTCFAHPFEESEVDSQFQTVFNKFTSSDIVFLDSNLNPRSFDELITSKDKEVNFIIHSAGFGIRVAKSKSKSNKSELKLLLSVYDESFTKFITAKVLHLDFSKKPKEQLSKLKVSIELALKAASRKQAVKSSGQTPAMKTFIKNITSIILSISFVIGARLAWERAWKVGSDKWLIISLAFIIVAGINLYKNVDLSSH